MNLSASPPQNSIKKAGSTKIKKTKNLIDDDRKKSIVEPFVYENGVRVYKRIPEDRLKLADKDLDEKIDRMINAQNPNAPQNIVKYDFIENEYKFEATVEQTAFHFSDDGCVLHVDSEEGKAQLREANEKKRQKEEEEARAKTSMKDSSDPKILPGHINQFNFTERATQTASFELKSTGVSTQPPPSMKFSYTVCMSEIYDTYLDAIAKKKQEASGGKGKKPQNSAKKEDGSGGEGGGEGGGAGEGEAATGEAGTSTGGEGGEGGASGEGGATEEVSTQANEFENDADDFTRLTRTSDMSRTVRLMEKMVLQNANDEILQDFKFWDDKSDAYREEGSLLPLLYFKNEKTKKKHVTALKWNSQYSDLFAVGFGSYDFLKQGSGAIVCYSLKNPTNPEYTYFIPDSGVMCLDFHPKHSPLLVAGLYNGNILICDIRQPKPVAETTISSGKHGDVIWDVAWDRSSTGTDFSFMSISSDSTVRTWNLKKKELETQVALDLKTDQKENSPNSGAPSGPANNFESGTCLHFNYQQPNTYLVGTEEGYVHECSKALNSQYLNTYQAHHLNVYSVKWNYFGNMFASTGADWSVRIWKSGQKKPLFSFDLGSAVGDMEWAPYSPSVFAAVTDDGRIHVYDLNTNKNDALCNRLAVKKAKLTKVTFNPKEPIILVGDDKGAVQTLKLSPNLRKVPKKLEGQTIEESRAAVLEKLIAEGEK